MKKPIGRKYISGVIRVAKRQYAICDEEGSGLVMTLMALLVLSILGISLGLLTVGSFRLSDANRDDTSAYYIAEAGAVKALNDLELFIGKKYEDAQTKSSYYDAINATFLTPKRRYDFDSQYGDETFTEVSISLVNSDPIAGEYMITSTGHVGKRNRTVNRIIKVNWIEKGGSGLPSLPEKAALVASEKLQLLNGSVDGLAYIDSKKSKSVKLAGGQGGDKVTIVYPEGVAYNDMLDASEIYEPTPSFISKTVTISWDRHKQIIDDYSAPTGVSNILTEVLIKKSDHNSYYVIDSSGNVNLNSWMLDEYQINLDRDIFIPNITIGSGKTLKINPNGGNYTILVNNLSVRSGNLDITGNGSVTLVVQDKMNFNQQSLINQSGVSDQLLVVYTGSNPNFSEITSINANIIVKSRNKLVTINNSGINGVFLTDSSQVLYSGGNADRPSKMVMIAPYADVELGSGYYIHGTIVAKTITLSGGGTILFKKIDTSGFPMASGESTSPTLEDLIESGPIIETQGE